MDKNQTIIKMIKGAQDKNMSVAAYCKQKGQNPRMVTDYMYKMRKDKIKMEPEERAAMEAIWERYMQTQYKEREQEGVDHPHLDFFEFKNNRTEISCKPAYERYKLIEGAIKHKKQLSEWCHSKGVDPSFVNDYMYKMREGKINVTAGAKAAIQEIWERYNKTQYGESEQKPAKDVGQQLRKTMLVHQTDSLKSEIALLFHLMNTNGDDLLPTRAEHIKGKLDELVEVRNEFRKLLLV